MKSVGNTTQPRDENATVVKCDGCGVPGGGAWLYDQVWWWAWSPTHLRLNPPELRLLGAVHLTVDHQHVREAPDVPRLHLQVAPKKQSYCYFTHVYIYIYLYNIHMSIQIYMYNIHMLLIYIYIYR